MNGASPPAAAKRLSDSSDRRPTWSKFNFDDGFDLNTASGSRDPLPFATTPAAFSKSPKGRDVPLSAHARRTSIDASSPHKALPNVPNTITESSSTRKTDSPMLSQDAPLPLRNNATAPDSSASMATETRQNSAPTLSSKSHIVSQPSRAQSGGGLSTWERPIASAHRPFSSADAYTQPAEQLQTEVASRPDTALSNLSGSGWMHDARGYNTSSKRASVLSFATAMSGGFDDAPTLDHDDAFQDIQPVQPWLDSRSHSHSNSGSLSGDRTVPGALPTSFWGGDSTDHLSTSASSSRVLPSLQTGVASVLDSHPQQQSSETSRALSSSALPPIRTTASFLSSPHPANASALSPSTVRAPSDDASQLDTVLTPHSLNIAPQPVLQEPRSRSPLPITSTRDTSSDAALPPLPPKAELALAPVHDSAPQQLPDVGRHFSHTSESQATPPFAEHKPVSDFRKTPLANIGSAQKAAGMAHLQSQVDRPTEQSRTMNAIPSVTAPVKQETPLLAVLERGRRKSNASLLGPAVMHQPRPLTPEEVNKADSESNSLDAPSREASPPPDGEVEARAEWERRQMKRKQKRESLLDSKSKSKADTLKNQLKPLQLVPAENFTTITDRKPLQVSSAGIDNRAISERNNGYEPASAPSTSVTTQQLQKNQAREQRRSVGAFSAAMAAANVTASGSNGPYPVFASPPAGTQKAGVRQYPGLMAQRSLVAPFELQHRPDGLPSGLIGPDGVRKSLNDPEVCLECMMRDEDMIDICVLGPDIWERESDKDFEEAVRLEAEAESGQGNGFDSNGHSIGSQRDPKSTRRQYKSIGKGDPVSVDRLKLHTQMNPPASSFRWRTLQSFLAVQAKYIAMEQHRMRAEAEKQRLSSAPILRNPSAESGPLLDTDFAVAAPVPPARDTSTLPQHRRPSAGSVLNEGIVTTQSGKEREFASVQAARLKSAQDSSMMSTPSQSIAPALAPLQTELPRQGEEDSLPTTSPLSNIQTSSASSRRVPTSSMQAARVSSVQDLRSAAESRASSGNYPASPQESLLPPSRSFVAASPSTPVRYANRSGASQLSYMHSGSMVDMHVAQEDRVEHRLNQNGFIPGTPLAVESPGAMQRSYYGFPGDGDVSLSDTSAFDRSRMVSGDGYVNPLEARPAVLDNDHGDSIRQKKKGFRGLFSKFKGPSREGSQGQASDTLEGTRASRNPSKSSQTSLAYRARPNSISADRSMDQLPPSGMSMRDSGPAKPRKSISSFFSPQNGTDREEDSQSKSQFTDLSQYQRSPGMTSQSSLDLGPFRSARNGQQGSTGASDTGRPRKAASPMMQKYLNSPSPGTQAVSPYQSANASAGGRRISSFASNKDLRQSSLHPILDTAREDQSVLDLQSPPRSPGDVFTSTNQDRSRLSQASARKDLPPMPPSGRVDDQQVDAKDDMRRGSFLKSMSSMQLVADPSAPSQSRVQPLDIRGRKSMQLSSQPPMGLLSLPFASSRISVNSTNDDGMTGPRRPPKNPRRPDGFSSPSLIDLSDARGTQESSPFARPQSQFGSNPVDERFVFQQTARPAAEASENGKVGRFLRVAFGRKKRESTMPVPATNSNELSDSRAPVASAGFTPFLKGRKSFSQLGLGRASMQMDRPRVVSSPADERQPPRSQSAFGMASRLRFVSMDGRRSMNVSRNARLSTMGDENMDDEDDAEEDGMGVDPGYEAEFNRFDEEARADRSVSGSGARGRDVSGGAASFGRKSLNLFREGFRMPLRQPSGDVQAKRAN